MKKATIFKLSTAIASALLILLTTGSALFAQNGETEDYRAFLSGANEVSPVFTTGSGLVALELDGSVLTISGSFEGLSTPLNPIGGTGAHIHMGFTGQNGGVEIPLNPTLTNNDTAGTFSETATLSTEQIDALRARQLYVNIHSETYPSGELRGQILPVGKTYFQTYASGGHEVPSNVSTAQGGLSLEYDGTDLVVTGSFNGLTSDYIVVGETGSGAHLHTGFAGQNGGVEISLTPTLSDDNRSGTFLAENNTFTNVDAAIVQTLVDRGHYLNIHSQDYPAGEIRGQVVPEANIYFYAPLSGMNEIPQNTSQATGAVMVEWYAETSTINATGSFGNLGSDYATEIGSHLHVGLAGQNGGVEIGLTPDLDQDSRGGIYLPTANEATLTMDQVGLLVSRSLYANIHTADYNGGEIRGQVVPLAQHYFTTSLTGLSEVDPVMTGAQGGMAFEFRNGNLTATGSFSGLESNNIGSAGSHIHEAAADDNGGVIYPLTPELDDETDARAGTYSAADNTFNLSETEIGQLVTAGLYVNVHSVDDPAGEIRGQILLAPNVAPETAPAITSPADGATVVVEGESTADFIPAWTSSEDANSDPVVYIWEVALDSEFGNIVFSANAGSDPSLPLTIGTVDGLLASLGVEEGSSATIYHRATASDGSGLNTGAGSSVTLERGVVTSSETDSEVVGQFELKQNYPNPFNPTTNITYSLPQQADVELRVFDMVGREVATLINREQAAGSYTVNFDASQLSSGMYLYRLNTGSTTITRKMMLIK
ncbi:CHRD domain-containing protein [Rhodohalobacter sp. 8-1]|uniref:CHRD domain-containing protein n=1 Tax=Rhodohalobacter sp. 8-1 TaxID=3131972 RepID=UPI0030EECA4A